MNLSKREKQMTVSDSLIGAALSDKGKWLAVNWQEVYTNVHRQQMRIVKAMKEKRWGKVNSLQRLLVSSFSAKLLAVRKVTSKKGANTPSIDGVKWKAPSIKWKAVQSLNPKGYKTLPLKRVSIPKKNGKTRPLGIPCMKDRAMQALFLLALEPISETNADSNSYGFRPYRASRDAIAQCFCVLAKKNSPKWVLEGDIKACFDWISHQWLMDNIPTNKKVLKQWLECGFISEKKLFPTKAGTPQGGVISPMLANMTLDGLERTVKAISKRKDKVNFVRYADDFIVTASSKEHLELKVKPAIVKFLKFRGLTLSEEKTKIVPIDEGFDFLGQNLRKFKNKLITQPSKSNYSSCWEKIRAIIQNSRGRLMSDLINHLNPIIRGWSNYHKYIQASSSFNELDGNIWHALLKWAKRRNPKKSKGWLINHFWKRTGIGNARVFTTSFKEKEGKTKFCTLLKCTNTKLCTLLKCTNTKLQRYIKIRGDANPHDSNQVLYFKMRRLKENTFSI